MESFGQRLRKLMEKCGLTEENMMSLLKISSINLENLLTGYKEPDEKIMTRVAEIFDVSLLYTAMLTEKELKLNEGIDAKEIYVVKSLSGEGQILKRDVIGSVFLNRDQMHGKEYFAYIAQDDSMMKARIFKGDMLIVRKQNFASNGDIAVVFVNGETMVRRFNKKGNIVILSPEGDLINYHPLKIDVSEADIAIIGKVCQNRIDF